MAKKTEKPKREVTKRQRSQWQRQRRRQRIILGLGIFIVVAVLGIVGAGWYIGNYRPLHQIVISVNDTEFNMDYYIKMIKGYGEGQPVYYLYGLADELVVFIQQNELVRQGALKLGISISDEVVDEELKNRGFPLDRQNRDLVRIEMLVTKLRDEHFEQEVPVSAEQRQVMAMLLESQSQAVEIRARLEAGEDFAELAGQLSVEDLSQNQNGDLGWHPEDVLAELLATSVPGEYAFSTEIGVLSQPIYDEAKTKSVGYWLVKVLERKPEPEQLHLQVILLGSEKETQDVKARLEAGEDFATLAKELSQHKATKEEGGDFGWVPVEDLTTNIVFAAWLNVPEQELEVVSEPLRDFSEVTTGGYWLLKVLDKDDDKQITDEDRDLLKTKAFNEWVSSLWDDPENEVNAYLTQEMVDFAIERASGG